MILKQHIKGYIQWLIDRGYSNKVSGGHEKRLNYFQTYIIEEKLSWDEIFAEKNIDKLKKHIRIESMKSILSLFSCYLYEQKIISSSFVSPPNKATKSKLPKVYEEYIDYLKTVRQVNLSHVDATRKTILALNDYLEENQINLTNINIEHIDSFLAEQFSNLSWQTCKRKRSAIRLFLQYLYQNNEIKKNFAPLITSPPSFGRVIPPKFLRPKEVKKLFSSLNLEDKRDLRLNAIIHLSYTLGLRPIEISLITLDDISFEQQYIVIPTRKNTNPLKLPLPENTLKAISAYIIGARPKSSERRLFLLNQAPYIPIDSSYLSDLFRRYTRRLNLTVSIYQLRHTYAQNLFEQSRSIYEVKEMLGHTCIETTKNYIHIDIKLMRKVLFNEEI